MSTSKPDKKFIPLIALGAIVVAAAAFAITSSGGSGPAGNPKTTVSPSATDDAESTLVDIELMALVDKAVEDCKTFKISCLNTAAIDVYKEQGLPSMIAFTEIVTAQAPKSFKCLEWGKQLGADMHKKYGEKAVDMKYLEVCQGAYYIGVFEHAGKPGTATDAVSAAEPLCDTLDLSAHVCGSYTAFTSMNLSGKNLKASLDACGVLKDETAARSCGSVLLFALEKEPTAADIDVCEQSSGPAAAGCANIASGFMIEKSVAAGTACASFKGIAFDDCEYGYGYFASSRGATDPVTVCGGSAWCARGFGWGASIAGGTASGTAACAKLTEDLVEACTAGTKMTGYRDTTTVDRPVPFARDNVAAAAPKTS